MLDHVSLDVTTVTRSFELLDRVSSTAVASLWRVLVVVVATTLVVSMFLLLLLLLLFPILQQSTPL
jgi:hypothetical protein